MYEQFHAACRYPASSPHLPWDLLIVDEAHNLMPAPFGEDSDPMLTGKTQPAASSLSQAAWAIMQPFVALNEAESRYVHLAFNGDHRPHLLFPDDPETERTIANHPQVRWKLQNVKAYRHKNEGSDAS